MQTDNRPLVRRLVVLAILCFLILPLCVTVYRHRSNAFAGSLSTNPVQFSNPSALENWLPEASLNYTVDRLNDYMKTTNPNAPFSSMVIASKVTPYGNGYNFLVKFVPVDITHKVAVRVINYGPTISTAVYIDDVVQRVTASANGSGVSFSGIDNLINQGVSSYQAEAIKQAFMKFKPDLSSVSIDSTSIAVGTPTNSGDITYSFDVFVDGNKYQAHATTSGLTQASLVLLNTASGKQVFDSGIVNAQG